MSFEEFYLDCVKYLYDSYTYKSRVLYKKDHQLNNCEARLYFRKDVVYIKICSYNSDCCILLYKIKFDIK